jgi:hypothetical protein
VGILSKESRTLARRATAVGVLLGSLVVAALFIVAAGSIRVSALDSTDSIVIAQDVSPFGIVIPGVTYTDSFEVCIGERAPGGQFNYSLAFYEMPVDSDPRDFQDMRPFLEVVRDRSEPDAEGDTLTRATLEAAVDDCDRWQITLTAPHCEGAYNSITDPQGSGVTIPCQVDRPTSDPQSWTEGSDLGARLGIEVSAVAAAVQMPVALPATGGEPAMTP